MKTKTSYITGFLITLLVMSINLSGYSTKWVVTVASFQFTPSAISNVNVGDTIRWEWVSGIHTTTSTSVPAGALNWDHPIDVTNTFFEYPVTISGTYNYHCMHHPTLMIGSFTVTGSTPTLSVTPSNRNVSFAAGNTNFTVLSNSSWTAVSDSSWCTVTPSGTGNGTITATSLSNPTVTERVASITVTVSGLTPRVVTVTQSGAPLQLAVAPPSQNVTTVSGTTDFTVTSNTDWTAASNSGWCTVPLSGTGNGTLTATYTGNAGPPRFAIITVTVTGLTPQQVTVNQDGTTGIFVNSVSSLRLYPNPTEGQLTVIPGDLSGKMDDLTVMDITGRRVLENPISAGQSFNIDLSAFPGGYYFVRLTTDSGIKVRKVILEK